MLVSSERRPLASNLRTSRCSAYTSSAPIIPFAGRWVRAYECPPSCASFERSTFVRSRSHSIAPSDERASSAISPPASRFADLAVSAAKASTVSAALRSARECGGSSR